MSLAKQVKKLIFSNKYTFDEISKLVNEPIETCITAFESYYKAPIPSSLLIVGNIKARETLKKYILADKSVLLHGNNGVGKDISLKHIATESGLFLRRCVPIEEKQIVQAFGEAPFSKTDFLFVIDVDSLPKKKYAVLKKYITDNKSPVVLTAVSRDSINKRVLSEVKGVHFTEPSPAEVEKFLRRKYNWDGNIADIYDEDMRIVISRVLNKIEAGYKIDDEEISSAVLAFDLSCGYATDKEFEKCKEPLWWVLRWLAFNQWRKFPNKRDQLENLERLSEIDYRKFMYNEKYLREMLMGLKTSQRRGRFSFPVWPKKVTAEKNEIEKMKKPKEKPPKKVIVKENTPTDFSKWL